MKKLVSVLISVLLLLGTVSVAFADDLVIYSDGSRAVEGSLDGDVGEDRDPGDYVTAPNGYAYTAPRIEDNSLKLYDFAGLIADDEEAALREEIEKAEKSRKCTVLVVTTRRTAMDLSYGTDVTRAYAEDFYEANRDGLSEDAWIMCVDMNNRVIYTVGYGKYSQEKYVAFTEKVYNDVVEYAGSGNYAQAVSRFAEDVRRLNNPLLAAIPTAVSLIISFVLSLLVAGILLVKHKASSPSSHNKIPVKLLEAEQRNKDVRFIGRHVTTRHISRDNGPRSGGGGGSFSGGMHTSGGGMHTSGGGGHF